MPMNPPAHVRLFSPETLAPVVGYSQIAEVSGGRMVLLAGQVAFDATRTLVGRGDFRAQAQQVFANIKTALAAVGADFSQVVKLNIYLLDRANLPVLREVRDAFVNTEAPPASTLLVVGGLAQEEFLLEVEAVASLPA
ncbi:MAG TPA: RidA family protein [Ktedonobacterales bacterium]|jgi:enamine deaminase RidA (YjgF/YER057c/UK114 family)